MGPQTPEDIRKLWWMALVLGQEPSDHLAHQLLYGLVPLLSQSLQARSFLFRESEGQVREISDRSSFVRMCTLELLKSRFGFKSITLVYSAVFAPPHSSLSPR